MKGKILLTTTVIFITIIFIEGCFYNKADLKYPSSENSCDTSNVRFGVEIKSILDASCKQCHNGSNSFSGIDLYNYSIISSLALNGDDTYGTLLSSVKHEGGASLMPQGEPMLQDCDINKIAAWVHTGAPDN